MKVDFHLHTHCSDGGLAPTELRTAVRRSGLRHWAVTDHDTLAGWKALEGELGLVPGVEVTAELAGHEVHIVGLGVDPGHAGFAAFLQAIRALRLQRIDRLIAEVGETARLSADRLSPVADTVTRSHLAQALVQLGRAGGIHEVFDTLIGDGHCAALGLPPYPTPAEVVAAIHDAGGQAILAHPGIYKTAEAIMPLLDTPGLDGVETCHPKLDPVLAAQLEAMAQGRGQVESCGSDTHWLGAREPGRPHLSAERIRPLLKRLRLAA
jgi:predicted metal-dependent phosphoesterase TrpH